MDRISAFISYASQEKQLAGKLKYSLVHYCGFDVFLAHEDIPPSKEWEQEIMQAIRACDYFIPLISESFRMSAFTDQEVGAAICLGKRIIPVKLGDINPYGFMTRYQAFQYRINRVGRMEMELDNMLKLATQIALLTRHYEDTILNIKATNSIVLALLQSNSFDTSNTIIKILCQMRELQATHLTIIQQAIKTNSQVQGAFALSDLHNFLHSSYGILLK